MIALITLLATLTKNGANPMETMLNRIPHSSLKYRRWNRNWLLGLKKCIMTNAAEMAIAISVAMAAPFIPQSNQKMKIGARIRLEKAPMSIVYMAFSGYPEARIILLKL